MQRVLHPDDRLDAVTAARTFHVGANRAFSMPPCGQPPLECDDVEWPVEPNPPREPDVLVDVLRELDGLL